MRVLPLCLSLLALGFAVAALAVALTEGRQPVQVQLQTCTGSAYFGGC